MMKKQISFKKEQLSNLIETIRNFSVIRGYILNESKYGSNYVFNIYDKKPESGMFMNMIEIFIGNYLLPERMMLEVKIIQGNDNIDVIVRCEVMMINWNIINDKPNVKDKIRCENLLENFVNHLNEPKSKI